MEGNAHLDAQALLDEYSRNGYGPATAPAFELWDEMERAIES